MTDFSTVLDAIHSAGYVLYTLHEEEPWCAAIVGHSWSCTVRRSVDRFNGLIGTGVGSTPAEAMDLALHHALSDASAHSHRDCYGGAAPDPSRPALRSLIPALAGVVPTRRRISA